MPPDGGRESFVRRVHRSSSFKTAGAIGQTKKAASRLRRAALAVAGMALLAIAGQSARAADQYFDGDGLGTVGGGPGVWDSTLLRWGLTPTDTTFTSWSSGNVANFGGNGGTITVTENVTASGLSFTGANYYIVSQGAPVKVITLDGGGSPVVVNVGAGFDAQANIPIAGSGGFAKTGGGSFGFYGALPTGLIDIQEGTLYLATAAADIPPVGTGAAGSLRIASGATLDMRFFNDTTGSIAGGGNIKLGTLVNFGINQGSRLVVGADNATTTFSGVVSGGGKLEKVGTGTLTLSGANTFGGMVTIQAGTVIVQGGLALPDTAPVFLTAAAATLQLDADEAVGSIGNNSITGTGAIVDASTHKLTIGGDNFYVGYYGLLNGSGAVEKVGSGTQLMLGTVASGFTGKYSIKGGILGFQADARMGPAPLAFTSDAITLAGGTLSNTTTGGFDINPNRGITVTADSGIAVYGSANSILAVGAQDLDRITGSGKITKSGLGNLRINSNNEAGFSGGIQVIDGTLSTALSSDGSPFGTGGLDVSAGAVSIVPAGSGADQVLKGATGVGSKFSYGPGAVLSINKGAQNSLVFSVGDATLAAGSNAGLVRRPNGSLLIQAAGGVANLGTSEKVMVNGDVATVNGIVPGVFGSTSNALTVGELLTYDTAVGFKPATYSASPDINAATATDVVALTSAVPTDITMSADRSVFALKVGDGSTAIALDPAGHTLTVSDGVNPGMLVVNAGSSVGAGTIDFGASEAHIFTQNTAGNFGATIKGSGGMTKAGLGQLRLTAPASYTGPTNLNQGSIILSGPNQLPTTTDLRINGNGTLDLNGNSQSVRSLSSGNTYSATAGGAIIAFGADGVLKITGNSTTTYLSGSTTGAGSTNSTLWKAGPGTLTLGQTLSITGLTSSVMGYNKLWVTDGGTVTLSSGNSIPNAPPALVADTYMLDNGTLRFNTLTATSGTTSLGTNGASTFSISAGATTPPGYNRGLTLGAGGGTIEIANPYEIAIMQLNNAETVGMNIISGSGNLTKTGPGFLRLGVGNTYTGRTIVKEGNLQFQTDTSVGGSALGLAPDNFVFNQLELDGGMIQSNGTGIINKNRGIYIGPNGGNINAGANFVLNSVISGPGVLTKSAASLMRLNADNNTVASMVLTNGATYFNGNESGPDVGGKITIRPDFFTTFGKNEGADSTISNDIVLLSGSTIDLRTDSGTSTVVNSILNGIPIGSLTLAGKISGTPNWFKGANGLGLNTAILSNGGNDFSGNLTISVGTLVAGTDHALGETSGVTIVNNAGTLGFRGGINYTTLEPIHIMGNGTGTSPVGAINSISGNNRFAGPVTMMASAAIGVAGDTFELAGTLRGAPDSHLTKVGGGTLYLVQPASYGNTRISEGTLRIGANNTLPVTTVLTMGSGSITPTLELSNPAGASFNQTVAGIASESGLGVVNNAGAAVSTFTVNNAVENTYAGVLSGNLNFTKKGIGSLALSGVNTYTGTTDVQEGTLFVNNSHTGTGLVTVRSGATLGGSGTIAANVSAENGGHIAPGFGLGTLTVGGLSLNSSAIDIEGNGGGFDLLSILGLDAFTAAGNTAISVSDLGGIVEGEYQIISYNNTTPLANLNNFSLATPTVAGFNLALVNDQAGRTIKLLVAGGPPQWNVDSGGSWSDAGNWIPQVVPDGSTAVANFLGKITSAATVTLDGNKTVNSVTFDNLKSYTIAPGTGGTLTVTGGGAAINSVSGDHTISAPVTLGGDTAVNVSAGAAMRLIGGLSSASGAVINKQSGGTLEIGGPQSHGAGAVLLVREGDVVLSSNAGKVASAGSAAVAPLSVEIFQGGGGPSKVVVNSHQDLGELRVQYTDTDLQGLDLNSPATAGGFNAVRVYAADVDGAKTVLYQAIRNAVTNPGDGIYDSGLHAGAKVGIAALTDAHGEHNVTIRSTRVGDLNLDGLVTISDFIDLASNFNTLGTATWQEGDLNGDQNVSISDFIDLASNFGGSYAGSIGAIGASDRQTLAGFASSIGADPSVIGSAVPEPGTLGLLAVGAMGLMGRRRRK